MAGEGEGLAALSSSSSEKELTLTVKWSGKGYTVRVCGDDSVGELKRRICQLTNVLPKRQKLLYPKLLASKLADDSVLHSHLPLKSSLQMTMVGTVEDEIIVDQVESPEILDDFELGQNEAVDIKGKEVNKQKLRRRIDRYKVVNLLPNVEKKAAIVIVNNTWDPKFYPKFLQQTNVIELQNPCRKGKKLLVLDTDYTLFDHRSTAENPPELMRPYLHEFLTAAYAEYDIVIWSAPKSDVSAVMKWVELKMGELGVLNNSNDKITALLDHMAMIAVRLDTCGIFDCKPLGLIWAQFPEISRQKRADTVMPVPDKRFKVL